LEEGKFKKNEYNYKNNKINKKREKFVGKQNENDETNKKSFYTSNNNNNKSNLLGKKRYIDLKTEESPSNCKTNKKFNKNNKYNKTNYKDKYYKNDKPKMDKTNSTNINYAKIPSDKLDDIDYLQNNYPKLFIPESYIKFKVEELLDTGIEVGDYHYGQIDNFNLENKSFLIKNCISMNEKTKLLMYQSTDDPEVMFIQLKDFVEIWIESDKDNMIIEKDNNLINNFIKRQIEYYFSDYNYEKDSYLKSKEDENGFIPISVIMSFNKIKMITTNKDLFVNALTEEDNENNSEKGNKNKLYELNDDLTKIRKIKLNFN
jgi:hypothetical protein